LPGEVHRLPLKKNRPSCLTYVLYKPDSTINSIYEIIYYVERPDYTEYMNIQQNMNLAIFKRFEEENIEFAFPTQTVFIEKDGQNVLDAQGVV
jgi:small-conductance mechanosensitive channel